MKRRELCVGIVGLAVGLGGCAATQEEFESTPATFADEAVAEAGYESEGTEEVVVERTVTAGGSERDVTVTNHSAEYTREVTLAGTPRSLVAAVAFSFPSMTIVGREFNPIADESRRELAGRMRDRIAERLDGEGPDDLAAVTERETAVLGTSTIVGVFEGTVVLEAGERQLRLLVTRVEDGGDYIVLGAAYPTELADEERPRVEALFGAVEHGEEG